MTIYDFLMLDSNKQAIYSSRHGVFICDREKDGFIFSLYVIHGFYFEIQRFSKTGSKVACQIFKTGILLEKYRG